MSVAFVPRVIDTQLIIRMEGTAAKAERAVRKKDPCRKQQIDFHLCEKKYGFNDQYCKCTPARS